MHHGAASRVFLLQREIRRSKILIKDSSRDTIVNTRRLTTTNEGHTRLLEMYINFTRNSGTILYILYRT